jgi:hypothetical protein
MASDDSFDPSRGLLGGGLPANTLVNLGAGLSSAAGPSTDPSQVGVGLGLLAGLQQAQSAQAQQLENQTARQRLQLLAEERRQREARGEGVSNLIAQLGPQAVQRPDLPAQGIGGIDALQTPQGLLNQGQPQQQLQQGLLSPAQTAVLQQQAQVDPEAALDEALDLDPWQRWRLLVSRPQQVFAGIPHESPWRGLLFGVSLVALGSVLSLPWEWWLIRSIGLPIAPAATGRVWVGAVILQPIFSLLIGILLTFLTLRLLRVPAQLGAVAAMVGYAKALEPVAAVPVVGEVLAMFGFLWLLAVGAATVYGLGPGRLAAFLLIPPLALLLGLVIGVALLALLLGQGVDAASLQELAGELGR